nr:MAG TPA: hypothetical protein [Caudoviricetes sp.]
MIILSTEHKKAAIRLNKSVLRPMCSPLSSPTPPYIKFSLQCKADRRSNYSE